MKTKVCNKCCVRQPLTGFYRNRTMPDGLQNRCKLCQSLDSKSQRPELRREWNLRKKYGITSEEYERLFEAQGGRCAICERADSGTRDRVRLHVDHCHTSGRIRGLLCHNCNAGLGHFQDSEENLKVAISYLRQSR